MIRVAQDDGVWTLTIDRPHKANALTSAMLESLIDAVARLEAAKARVMILTGAEQVFSAGADLDEARVGLATSPLWEELSGRIVALPCLTIAALNGTLAGGAFGMALACDLRLAVRGAKLFYPVMKLGFLPQPSDPQRIAALIGPARAKMLLMAGAHIDAEEALAWGLVDRLCPPGAVMDRARALAGDAARADATHIAAIKRLIPMVEPMQTEG